MKKFYSYLIVMLVLIGTGVATAHIADYKFKPKQVTEAAMAKFTGKQKANTVKAVEFNGREVMKGIEAKAQGKTIDGLRRATPVISEAEGESKFYSRAGGAYYYSNYAVYADEQEGNIEIVFGDDNTVYLNNIISYAQTGTYVKGTLEDNKITVDLPQTVYPGSGYNLEVAWVNITLNEDGEVTSTSQGAPDRETTQAVFEIDGNTIKLLGSSATHALGGVWDDDDSWYGAADFESEYTLIEDLPEPVALPEGAEVKAAYLNGKAYYSRANHIVENQEVAVAQVGDDFYFQGLLNYNPANAFLPEAWIKGTLADGKITVPAGQYVGTYNGEFIYVVGDDPEDSEGEDVKDIVFAYDEEAGTFTLENNLYINGKPDAFYFYGVQMADNVISFEPFVVPDLVELPDGVEPEADWTIQGIQYFSSDATEHNEATEVAFDGSDVYIKGLSANFPEAWVKGAIEDGKASFAPQYVGRTDDGFVYLLGFDVDAEEIIPFSFDYDAENKIFTLNDITCENLGDAELYYYSYYAPGLKVYKGEPAEFEEVEVPADLETKAYIWESNLLEFDDDDEPVYTEESRQILIGVDGDDVYVQGLCTDLPEAWVKGKKEGNTVTFAAPQFLGEQIYWFWSWNHYFLGYGKDGIKDAVFTYDEEADKYTSSDWIVDNEFFSALNYYQIHTDNVFKLFNEVEGKPQPAEILNVDVESAYPHMDLSIPTTDENGNMMNLNKVFYRVLSDIETDIEVVVFSADDYIYFTEDLTEIPYKFDDGYDIYAGGERVYLNQSNLSEFNRIGVQVINYSGIDLDKDEIKARYADATADNESEITWYTIKGYSGITNVNADATVTAVRYLNAAGQSASTPFQGVNIVVKTMSDGSTRVMKVIK